MIQSIDEMISTLKRNTKVIGTIEYGSDHQQDDYEVGDYDIFVVLDHKDPILESLHFRIAGVPVDLNLVTINEIGRLDAKNGFHFFTLLGGRVVHDTNGKVARALDELRRRSNNSPPLLLSAHTVAATRHGHRHIFDKIKGRLETEPVFCRFLLGTNIYWLIKTYFEVRGIVFTGEKNAIEYLRHHEPTLYEEIALFYDTQDLEQQVEITRRLTEIVLTPIDGMWRDGEILAFGDESSEELQKRGSEMFRSLFGSRFD